MNLSSGECQFTYQEGHQGEAGTPLRVPQAFLVMIPVFKGGTLYQVLARLRYRLTEGRVVWSYALHQADRCADDARKEAREKAHEETKLPLFMGMPERSEVDEEE